MKSIPCVLSAALLSVTSMSFSASEVGVKYSKVFVPERERDIQVTLWYPAEDKGEITRVGENGLFYGAPAQLNAEIVEGEYPLVVISHGGGGNGAQFGWLANALVQQGFVVVAPNHNERETGEPLALQVVKVWLRASDISAVIDGLASDAEIADLIDAKRVGVFGFSAGGYSALAVAGVRVDEQRLTRYCDGESAQTSDCEFLRRGGVDLHQIDLSQAGRDNRDQRVVAVMAVDPGIAPTLTKNSMADIQLPVALVNMGVADEVPRELDASVAAQSITGARFNRVEDGNHFSLLPRCKPAAPYILQEEGELDPLCDDVEGGRSRAKIQQQIADEAAAFFIEHLIAR